MSLQREMRQKGQPSKLQFDKLVTDRAIFTYDLDKQEVRREDNRRRHGGSGPSTKQDSGLVHVPASNNRGGAVTDINTRCRPRAVYSRVPAASCDTEPTTGESDQQGRCHRQHASNTPTEPEDWESHPHWYPEAGQQHGTKAAEFDIQLTSSWWHHEYHCCPRTELRNHHRRPREQEQLHSDDGCGSPAFNTRLTNQPRIRQGTNQDSSCTHPHRLHVLLSPTQPCPCGRGQPV